MLVALPRAEHVLRAREIFNFYGKMGSEWKNSNYSSSNVFENEQRKEDLAYFAARMTINLSTVVVHNQ
ncbi:prickle planar cell polarity protein 3 isoform X5 [Vespula maculifrons]|uniref:Prickle planar cell polarity protein 3 isoform X5 n=1 Tax=Vespula maculifrons TaxID=7453 RepID=A0ABD2BV26_VESMC